MDALLRYHWPGNVRQLRNAITTTAALTDAATIDVEALPEEILTPAPAPTPGEDGNLQLATVERAAIEQALRRCEGNVSRAARQLGIARSTLYCRIQEQHIPIPGADAQRRDRPPGAVHSSGRNRPRSRSSSDSDQPSGSVSATQAST